MTINVNQRYTADIITSDGTFTILLLPKLAPVAVNNFIFLSRHHFYDRNPFTRIIQTFMVQTGDPSGTGAGGPGYSFKDELHKSARYTPGTVAMANSGPNTNGSQFFVVTGPDALKLPVQYTIFGRVVKGMNVVDRIANTPVTNNPGSGELSFPLTKVAVRTVVIH